MTGGTVRPGFRQALAFWWVLGWISFGGPAGQIAIMHSELVERRRWVDEAGFLHALNFCMLLPGPEAMQLATYLGWRLHGLVGGLVAGLLFILPAAGLLAGLSWLYLAHGQLPIVSGIVLGLSAAVLALLLQALLRLGRRLLRNPVSWLLALAALVAISGFGIGFPWIIVAAGLVGLASAMFWPAGLPAPAALPVTEASVTLRPPRKGRALGLALALVMAWWLPLLAVRMALGPESTAWAMGLFFSKAALVTFGGAYAVLPYVAQQAVEHYQWLTAGQMLVGLGLSETTPGPLILVLEFVGFVGGWQRPDLASPLASAVLGAAVTVWATFLPSFLLVLPAAPWVERLRDWPRLTAAMAGISAAVVGVIASLALWFGLHLFSAQSFGASAFVVVVAVLAWLALVPGRWPTLPVILLAAVAGAVHASLVA
jgi:chromate transporter